MKRVYFILFSAVLFLSVTSCKKIGEVCFDFAQSTTITTNPVTSPGTVTVTKTLANILADQLSAKGASINNVNSVKVNQIVVTIPASAGYTFADISSAEVTANGQSIGKLPSGTTGLVATYRTGARGCDHNFKIRRRHKFCFYCYFYKSSAGIFYIRC